MKQLLNEFKRMQQLAGVLNENLEQDILDFWGVQQDDAAQSDGEYEAEWDTEFFIDNYPQYEGKEQEINNIVKTLQINEAEIGKDEILAGKIMKALKDMANKDASDQNNLKQARIALNKGNMDAAEKIAKPYLSEKIVKKLTKDELKEMIKNSINEDDIDEGFFDRLKSNIKGITAKTSTTFDNLKAFAKGDKEAVKNPKLAQNMAKLQQKAKTLDSELASVMKDMSILFPEDVISQTPEEFQTILSQYTGMLDAVKNLNTKISKGELVAIPAAKTSPSTPPPLKTPPPATPTSEPATNRPSASVADKLVNTPSTAATSKNQKMYSFKGKNYPLQTDKDGSYIVVDGTKRTVQPTFDPNKGVTTPTSTTTPTTTPTTPSTTQKQPQSRDEKGRFVSTKKIAEIIAKQLKSK